MHNQSAEVQVPRRVAVAAGAVGIAALFLRDANASAEPDARDSAFPHLHDRVVQDFVGVCHRDIDAVRRMLDERPGLVHACWDWGFGDFETGLGAASHTGRREIAELLISRGARVDVFAAAMLGWTDVVRAMVVADPRVKATLGPHGITLLAHARSGGKAAEETLAWLTEQGGADESPSRAALTPTEADVRACVGRYRIDTLRHTFEIRFDAKQRLEVVAEGGSPIRLFLVKGRTFFPAGVPSVEIIFDDGALAAGVRIKDGTGWLGAHRLDETPDR